MERLTKRDYHDFAIPIRGTDAVSMLQTIDRLAAIEDILGEEYELDRLRELVELYSNVPHICDYCTGCEIEPADGHGCDGIYDNFVFSIRRIVAALKAREQDGNNK